jgi:hypothetical protein
VLLTVYRLSSPYSLNPNRSCWGNMISCRYWYSISANSSRKTGKIKIIESKWFHRLETPNDRRRTVRSKFRVGVSRLGTTTRFFPDWDRREAPNTGFNYYTHIEQHLLDANLILLGPDPSNLQAYSCYAGFGPDMPSKPYEPSYGWWSELILCSNASVT